jgi:hypothetical protein
VEEELQEGIEGNIHITTDEPPEEMAQQNRQQEHQGGNVKESKDEADARKKAPLSSTPQDLQDQPPLLHPEHLELIFDVRSMVDDQIFRAIRINQCLDMIYAAYSNTSPRHQCPTCAQVYAILVRRGKNGDDDENTG